MFAIFEAKGKQFRAEMGATLRLPSLQAEPGERITFDHVLLTQQDGQIAVGRPEIRGASIAAEVIRHGRGEKIVVYKMKRRKGYRRKQGHRQGFTDVRVLDIALGDASAEKPGPATGKKRAAAPRKQAPKAAPVAEATPEVEAAAPEEEAVELLVTDLARALAEEAGIDLGSIEGTGKGGRILKGDVQKAIKQRGEE